MDASTEVLDCITSFNQDLASMVLGSTSPDFNSIKGKSVEELSVEKTYIQKNRYTYARFKALIRNTAPDFRPFEDFESYTRPPPLKSDDEKTDDTLDVDIHSDDLPKVVPHGLEYVRQVIKESDHFPLTAPYN